MSRVDETAVRLLAPLNRVLELLGWRRLGQVGKQLHGACPVCKRRVDNNRYFTVSEDHWYCYECRQGGNSLDLYALVVGKPREEAAVELCGKLCVPVPYKPEPTRKPRIR